MHSDEEIRALGNLGLGCIFVFSLTAQQSSDPSSGDADGTQAVHSVESNETGLLTRLSGANVKETACLITLTLTPCPPCASSTQGTDSRPARS